MKDLDLETPPAGLNPYDVLFILYKHKWKVLLCTVVGLLAATGAFFTDKPLHESDAKLLVRYVVDRSAADPVDGANAPKLTDSVIFSEIEILTSWDLCEQVAKEIGIERLMPEAKGSATEVGAAMSIASGLSVSARGAGVIVISYKNSDSVLAKEVLVHLLERYKKKHLDIHRLGAMYDIISQKNELLKGSLSKTEDDLKTKKAEAGIISITDTAAAISAELSNTEHEINAAQTELARQRALVQALEKEFGEPGADQMDPGEMAELNCLVFNIGFSFNGAAVLQIKPPEIDAFAIADAVARASSRHGAGATNSTTPEVAGRVAKPGLPTFRTEPDKPHISAEVVEKYQACLDAIAALRKKGFELRAAYNSDAQPVKVNETNFAALENQRHDLEQKYPELLAKTAATATVQDHQPGISTERAKLASMKAGMNMLEKRLNEAKERAKEFAKVAPAIEELEREKQLEQTKYTSSSLKVENATVDRDLNPSNMPNISSVQEPSPAFRVPGKRQKFVLGLAGGGLGLGIALALLAELVLDQTVKRPMELERQLRIPLLLSIPYISHWSNGKSPCSTGKKGDDDAPDSDSNDGQLTVAPWEPTHFLRSYSHAIRDRLCLFFELNNLTHKPKLIAVTGFSKNSGASTIAAGIAAALSETDDGKVLLVDMNVRQGEAHPFYQGEPASSLTAALKHEGEITSATENLYVAAGIDSEKNPAPVGFKRFHDLIPNFEASAFDYIVFDMPPVSQMSATSGMARFMDKVLFVIEAERCNRDMVKRAYADLVGGRSNVAVVLNKVRSHAPKWIEGDL